MAASPSAGDAVEASESRRAGRGRPRRETFFDRPPTPGVALACSLLLALTWGTTWAAIRVGLPGIPPFLGVSLRFVIASTLQLLLAWALGLSLRGDRLEWTLRWVHALCVFCISFGITYWVEQTVPSGLASVLFATFPLFVALFAALLLPGERLGRLALGGLVLGFLGVATIVSQDFRLLGGREVAIASAIMLGSPLAVALGNVIVKRWGERTHPVTLNATAMVIAAVVMGMMAALFERDRAVVFDTASVLALLYLAVAGSVVTFSLYFWLLRHVPATRVSLIAYLVPVVAVTLGVLAFDEPVTMRMVVGGGLVLAGVALANR